MGVINQVNQNALGRSLFYDICKIILNYMLYSLYAKKFCPLLWNIFFYMTAKLVSNKDKDINSKKHYSVLNPSFSKTMFILVNSNLTL